jgi:rod shape-determining protein MreD
VSRGQSQPLQPWVWLGVPMLACIAATLFLAAPLKIYGVNLPEPVFAMVPAFAWAVIRPSLMGPFALLLLGLFDDLFWGGPLGLWPASLLMAYFGILICRNLIMGQSAAVLWGWYAAAAFITFACAYLFSLFDAGVAPNLTATLLQFAVTAALYPLANRLIDRFEDADVRFR